MNIPGAGKREQADKTTQNIQDGFLNTARKEKLIVTIYLMTGVKLSGRIRSFDKFSLVLENNHQEQLVFKHAISTVAVQRPTASPPTPAVTEG
ncbi:MAG: RNA chaperone Hfq [Terriglobia bacterium]